jgi:hypothetical protein
MTRGGRRDGYFFLLQKLTGDSVPRGYAMTRGELLEAYAHGADLTGADLRGVDLRGVKLRGADLRDANLHGANLGGTYLHGVNLYRADLRDANLHGANLCGADLHGANLCGADLRGVDLRGADLCGASLGSQWVIQGGCRSDGHFFLLQKLTCDSVPMVKAGCRYLTVGDAVAHWTKTRGGTPRGDESLFLIRQLVELAKMRGLMK